MMIRRILLTFALLMLLLPQARAQQLTGYEYWFDDNVSERFYGTLSGGTAVINTDISTDNLSLGAHRLNLRVRRSDGMYSPVTSTVFVKLLTGEVKMLEYWLDGDLSTSARVTGRVASTGDAQIFNTELDLCHVPEGMHHLYCRGVSEDGGAATSVTMMPVMVKPRLKPEKIDAVINKYSMTVDDEPLLVCHVSQPGKEVSIFRDLDLRDLKPGKHRLKVDVWNSAYAGVSLDTTFMVTRPADPEIQLAAEEKNGLVYLSFNSIPNDVAWKIIRTDANGVSNKADGGKQSCYPNTISSVDNPTGGTYTYTAVCNYTDIDGTPHEVTSNAVTVTVAPSANRTFGYIVGKVILDDIHSSNRNWTLQFSDGVTVTTDVHGLFNRRNVPAGEFLQVNVVPQTGEEGFVFDQKSITVSEGRNELYIFGKVQSPDSPYDLQFNSNIEFMPRQYIKFKVRNIRRHEWTGFIAVTSANKQRYDNQSADSDPLGQTGAFVGAGNVAPAPSTIQFIDDYCHSEQFTLLPGQSREIEIAHKLTDSQQAEYYFFVESVNTKENSRAKPVAINNESNIRENPFVQIVGATQSQQNEDQKAEEDLERVTEFLLGLCSTVTELDGKLGDLQKYGEEMKEMVGYTLDYYDLAGKLERSGSYSYLLDEIPEWKFYKTLYYEDDRFLNMIHKVRDKIKVEVKACADVLQYVKKAKKCLDLVKSYEEFQDMTPLQKAGAVADKILSMSENEFPFAKVLKTYLDITKASVKNINLLGEKYHAGYHAVDFEDGVFKYAVQVKNTNKWWFDGKFSPEEVKEQILEAEVVARNINPSNSSYVATGTAKLTPVVEDGKLYLKKTGSVLGESNGEGTVLFNGSPIKDMWIKIWWKNGRVTYVPLRHGGEVVGNGVTYSVLSKTYTITFKSGTNKTKHLADIIKLDDPEQ